MPTTTFRFADFELDPANRKLWQSGKEVLLPPKVFNCIVHLVTNRERAVGREELIKTLWGTVHLSDGVLAQTILQARQAVGDTGQEQRYIETVRGFGYRWASPVDVVEHAPQSAEEAPLSGDNATAAPTSQRPARQARFLRVGLALLTVALVAFGVWFLQSPEPEPSLVEPVQLPHGEGRIALLLPVEMDDSGEHGWIRLGLMDLIAARLRDAGQAMVPSDTVIALLQQDALPDADSDEMARLMDVTGAALVLEAQARVNGTRWSVSLHSRNEAQPTLAVVGEAHDVLEAARIAADRLSLTLGLEPAAASGGRTDLQLLRQQIEAASLARQPDRARELIDSATPELRDHPEIRLQLGRLELHHRNLERAREILELILEDVPVEQDRILRARVLNALGSLHAIEGERDTAQSLLEQAAELLDQMQIYDTLGTVLMNLGTLAQKRGDFETARTQAAEARRVLNGIGDVLRLAVLDTNVGVLENRLEHHARALRYYHAAAGRHAAVNNLAGELLVATNMIATHHYLLDLEEAKALDPRAEELLERVGSAHFIAHVSNIRAELLDTLGQREAAQRLVAESLAASEDQESLYQHRLRSNLMRLRWLLESGEDPDLAVSMADQAAAELVNHGHLYEDYFIAGLERVRARLARGTSDDVTTAASIADQMATEAETYSVTTPRVFATLALAEVAAATSTVDAARKAYEDALVLAESSQTPLRVLQVATSYVPWLIDPGPGGSPNLGRALVVANLLADRADQHFDAAMLQLRVYHALGPTTAWRSALSQARSLAGEREIPEELRKAP